MFLAVFIWAKNHTFIEQEGAKIYNMKRYLQQCLLLLLPVTAIAGATPIEFVENQGQWQHPFLYKATTSTSDIYLEKNGITYLIGANDNPAKIHAFKIGAVKSTTLNFHAYRMIFDGANAINAVEGSKYQQHYYNYFLGNNPDNWKSGIHPCLNVDYKNVYNNIDLHLSSAESKLKYDFIVTAGADPAQIKLRFEGADALAIKNNKLEISTSIGIVRELAPYAYQYKNGERVEVNCRYKLRGNTISYSFPDGYDRSAALIIDPTVVFSTFTGSSYDNWGYTATYDAQGNFYAGGLTSNAQGGTGYPTSTGAIQTSFGGGSTSSGNAYPSDIAIMKFNSAGNAMIYSTYLGGSDNEQPHSLIVDASGNLYIAGRTYSSNFPVTSGSYDNTYNGAGDLVVVKFNATGTSLLASTYVGGGGEDIANYSSTEFGWGNLKHNYGDDARSEIIIDRQSNVYIAACTKSPDFPTTASAIKTTLGVGDAQDAVVLKLNSNLSNLLWSTYLGGSNDDAAYVLALDTSQNDLYVGGGTMSSNFPTTSGALTTAYQGSTDGFIARFQNGGTYALQKATFIGRSGYDQVYGMQMDANNNLYAMGQTLGGTFPVSSGVYSNPGSSQFVIKLDHDLASNLMSTVFGSGSSTTTNISPVAFLIDTCENIYISGWGGDIYTSSGATPPPGTGTTNGMPITSNAAQSTTDGADFYFIVLAKNMSSLMYGTYWGANTSVPEHVDGGTSRFDKNGVVYQAICAACGGPSGTFPTTPGAYATSKGSNNCNLGALKIAFNFSNVVATPKVSPNKTICPGQTVQFTNSSTNATSYEWDFGDGSPISTQTSPSHIYNSGVGTFNVRFVAINPSACKTRDTAYLTIKVDTNYIKPNFTLTQLDTCYPYRADVLNTSKYSKTPASTQFTWDFGDGNTSNSVNPPTHQYAAAGTYTITLLMRDTTACNSPDSTQKTASFNGLTVDANFDVSDICDQSTVNIQNNSSQATTYLWDLGNGKTSANPAPSIKYDSAGSYKIVLIAYNPASCNKTDTISKTVNVRPTPDANFSHSPIVPETNKPISFTNKSTGADSYKWNFGDGMGSEDVNPVHMFKKTGTYLACLIASNKFGCYDTICRNVDADVFPLADLPTAFSPNDDGVNDILYVRGAGIEKMNLVIYNRFGERIFESNDVSVGWDGKYKGRLQPMEAYAFVLNVTFVDNTTYYKTGNVTLLR